MGLKATDLARTQGADPGRRTGHRPLRYLALKWQAQAWLVLGARGAALAVFNRLLAAWPGDAYGLASRAHLHAQAGRTAHALDDAQALVQRVPLDAQAWFNLGFLLETAEHWEPALAAFVRATELSPALDRAWYGQALVLIRLQRLDEAAAALQENTALQPMSPYGWYQLARVHLDRQQPAETLKIIRHLRGFEPRVAAQLERETGLILAKAGR